MVLDIVNAKIVPEGATEAIFSLGPEDSFQKGILSLTIVIVLLFFVIGLNSCCKMMCSCSCAQKLYGFLKAKLVFNSILRASLQAFFATFTSLVLLFKNVDTSTTSGTIDLTLAIILLMVCVGFTVFSLQFLRNNFDDLHLDTFRNRFGSLYLNVNTEDTNATRFTFFFLLRRILFVGVIMLCSFSIVLQVMIADVMSTLLLAFYLSVLPMRGVMNNLTEIVNEASVLASIMYMFVFTDYVPDPVVRYAFGYNFLYFVGGVIALNLLTFIFTIVNAIVLKFRAHFT